MNSWIFGGREMDGKLRLELETKSELRTEIRNQIFMQKEKLMQISLRLSTSLRGESKIAKFP